MRVYSLGAKQGDPRYLQAAQCNYWFWQRGYDVVSFEREQLRAGELDADLNGDTENTLVYGSVAVVREAILRAWRPEPPNLDFPPSLAPFIGRAVFESTTGDVRDWDASQPVTEDGRTILVEVNDGFALGNYGVRGHHYTALIECRWRELMGLDDNGVGLEW